MTRMYLFCHLIRDNIFQTLVILVGIELNAFSSVVTVKHDIAILHLEPLTNDHVSGMEHDY